MNLPGKKRPGGQPSSRQPPWQRPNQQPTEDYESFRASLLYCPTCRQATPTRERLLLILPTGNLYEYLCTACGTSTGSKTERDQREIQLFLP